MDSARKTIDPPSPHVLELVIGSRTVRFETGKLARQANASVLVREGESVVLVTAVGAKEARAGVDFFPLTVEYREKTAAAGRIPGGFLRREGRVSDHEVLACRILDRSLRPLFPEGYKAEVQIQATVLSAAAGVDTISLALLGAGMAIAISDIPCDGPMLGCRSVIYRNRTTLLPVPAEREEATADLMVSVGPQGLVMVEGEALETPGSELLDHILTTLAELEKAAVEASAWVNECGKPKLAWEQGRENDTADTVPGSEAGDPAHWIRKIEAECGEAIDSCLDIFHKKERHEALARQYESWLHGLAPEDLEDECADALAAKAFRGVEKKRMRKKVVTEGVRLDGRGSQDIRPIWGECGWLPAAHGSAVFTRGETQAMVSCTLGSGSDAQLVDTLWGREERRFLLHYNFPPYSVGETRPLRGPGRREIGHGNLALRALVRCLPPFEDFPYTIRIESDISESNGSSSMATVCGGCLALMDCGVPIKTPVAGIAMGLIEEEGQIVVLSDILGDEDHMGDMDFKVCGTRNGITALQMDNKIGGLTREVLEKALDQALGGIDHILDCMAEILPGPREDLPAQAPQVRGIRILPHLIGALIGPKGATIKALQEESGARVNVDDSGLVTIYASDGNSMKKAVALVNHAVGAVQKGGRYTATVGGVKEFGAFVKIYENAEGLLPREKLGQRTVEEGSELEVRVTGVDNRGRLQLELP